VGNGQYHKDRRRITEPVVKFTGEIPEVPRINEAEMSLRVQKVATETVRELDKDRLVFKKKTGWAFAGLVVTVLSSVAFLGSRIITKEHQLEHALEKVDELESELEVQRRRQMLLERRLVEVQTKLENME
jgi:hypothetical protein